MYCNVPLQTKYIFGCCGISPVTKMESPDESNLIVMAVWQTLLTTSGQQSVQKEKKGCTASTCEYISKWISARIGSETTVSRSTLFSGVKRCNSES